MSWTNFRVDTVVTIFESCDKKYAQKMPQSQTTDQPMAPRGRDTQSKHLLWVLIGSITIWDPSESHWNVSNVSTKHMFCCKIHQKAVMLLIKLKKMKRRKLAPTNRPLAGYGLPPPRGNFVDHIFLKAQCLARILQHVSPLTMAALSCNSLLHTLPYKIFDN